MEVTLKTCQVASNLLLLRLCVFLWHLAVTEQSFHTGSIGGKITLTEERRLRHVRRTESVGMSGMQQAERQREQGREGQEGEAGEEEEREEGPKRLLSPLVIRGNTNVCWGIIAHMDLPLLLLLLLLLSSSSLFCSSSPFPFFLLPKSSSTSSSFLLFFFLTLHFCFQAPDFVPAVGR